MVYSFNACINFQSSKENFCHSVYFGTHDFFSRSLLVCIRRQNLSLNLEAVNIIVGWIFILCVSCADVLVVA